ncbi:hypothetical protein FB451DRAFT_1220527 [Mycena latifolia]|nr:hypothetical protein FB451DRAFT_1220527 [Mycena latifolia]
MRAPSASRTSSTRARGPLLQRPSKAGRAGLHTTSRARRTMRGFVGVAFCASVSAWARGMYPCASVRRSAARRVGGLEALVIRALQALVVGVLHARLASPTRHPRHRKRRLNRPPSVRVARGTHRCRHVRALRDVRVYCSASLSCAASVGSSCASSAHKPHQKERHRGKRTTLSLHPLPALREGTDARGRSWAR